jgi:hypothetical protein
MEAGSDLFAKNYLGGCCFDWIDTINDKELKALL